MRLATIDLDWLDMVMESAESEYLSIPFMRENDLSKAFMKLSTLTVVRSKCKPIDECFTLEHTSVSIDKKANVGITDSRSSENHSVLLSGEVKEMPTYCVVKNKEYCFLSGKCKECSNETLPKTCLNQWESSNYCSNEGMCELCKIN